jgi:hypothetical protein
MLLTSAGRWIASDILKVSASCGGAAGMLGPAYCLILIGES